MAAVLADAGYGDVADFRTALHAWHLVYAVGIASTTSVFRGTPQLQPPTRTAKPGARRRPRPTLARGDQPIAVSALAAAVPASAWRRVTWRNGINKPRAARFAACRVTPAHDWQQTVAPEVWLLCERSLDGTYDDKFFLIHLPPRTSLVRLVTLAHWREREYAALPQTLCGAASARALAEHIRRIDESMRH